MPLTNAQYESIIRGYEKTRTRNRRLLEERLKSVYANVEGYKELDESVASISVEHAKKRILGDTDSIGELHDILCNLRSAKSSLLTNAGYQADYLDPIYDCPDCQDTGYIGIEKCHCFKHQIISIMYEQSNILESLKENNFSSLSYEYYTGEDLEQFRRTVDKCHTFVDTFSSTCNNLMLYGTVGTGKSFLSGCIAKALLDEGKSVIYFSAASFFDNLAKKTFSSKVQEDLYNPYEYIYNCDLLIVDDLGTELTNIVVSTQFFACINERNLRKKSTIISTNLSLEELRDRYSERIFSRILSNYTICKLSGPDIRTYKKRVINRK